MRLVLLTSTRTGTRRSGKRTLDAARGAKVRELDGAVDVDENVRAFDVPVRDALRMQVLQPLRLSATYVSMEQELTYGYA